MLEPSGPLTSQPRATYTSAVGSIVSSSTHPGVKYTCLDNTARAFSIAALSSSSANMSFTLDASNESPPWDLRSSRFLESDRAATTLGSSNASHGVVAVIAVKGPPARADKCLTTDDIPAPPTE